MCMGSGKRSEAVTVPHRVPYAALPLLLLLLLLLSRFSRVRLYATA